jgi:putative glutamine amidotransferase
MPVLSRNERRDALDQRWSAFFELCGLEAVPVPNRHADPVAYVGRLGVQGIVLSGGGNVSQFLGTFNGRPARVPETEVDLAPERDVAEVALLRASIERGWPVIGVCRGMQVLNAFHGGSLASITGHAGTCHALAAAEKQLFEFDGEVNSFHEMGIPLGGVASGLRVLASADGHAEAFIHQALPHVGIMWHPERNQPFSKNDVELFRRVLGGGKP